ncbi:taperin-like isoform X2 [Prinia subflava]|uniref:taperin-like isoform X2 n=1 Tax=Prinia subflava TaxID=208062 RepID=UPI002FE2CA50
MASAAPPPQGHGEPALQPRARSPRARPAPRPAAAAARECLCATGQMDSPTPLRLRHRPFPPPPPPSNARLLPARPGPAAAISRERGPSARGTRSAVAMATGRSARRCPAGASACAPRRALPRLGPHGLHLAGALRGAGKVMKGSPQQPVIGTRISSTVAEFFKVKEKEHYIGETGRRLHTSACYKVVRYDLLKVYLESGPPYT